MLAIKNILHPTDFSRASEEAFRFAVSLARDYGAKLTVLHVAEPPVIAYGEGPVPFNPVEYKEALRQRLHQLQAHDPEVKVEWDLIEGHPATEILRTAEEVPCQLIVLGTHGRTGLSRLLLGSVAEQVLRNARCLVLTVKSGLENAHNMPGLAVGPGAETNLN